LPAPLLARSARLARLHHNDQSEHRQTNSQACM
jgi:hypothetical protein